MSMLGAVAAVGLVVQIILGFALAGSSNPKGDAIVYPHVIIGVLGLVLVAYLAMSIMRTAGSPTVRLVYVLALVLTLAQVAIGFALLDTSAGSGALMAHQGIALLILILLAAAGVLSARSRRMSGT
jgi:hypothetical protein